MMQSSTSTRRKHAWGSIITGVALLSLLLSSCNFPFKQVINAVSNGNQGSAKLDSALLTAHACPTYTAPISVQNADPAVPTPLFQNRATPDGVINWLVLGSDYRPDAGFRTDTIMLVSIHTKTNTVSVVSFPRDLYINIPGWTTQRINTAMQHGGFSMLQDTFAYNFGVCPSGFLMTNFEGFKSIVDGLGGVDVNVEKALSDNCDLPSSSGVTVGGGWCSVTPGVHPMDGATALWFVRSRHSTSDFERLTRAQEVIAAVFTKIASNPSNIDLNGLFARYKDSVQTNLTAGDILPLLPLAIKTEADPSQVQRFTLAPPMVKGFITSGGGDVQLPDYAAIGSVLDKAVFEVK
jgi:LCP family protein required for cell wall assembly